MSILPFSQRPRLSNRDLFYLEQWVTFLIGIACLGVSAWAGFSGLGEVSLHPSWLAATALFRMKYLLTIAVSLIGTALVRFAFSKFRPADPATPARDASPVSDKGTKGDQSARSTLAEPAAIHKGRH